jgi:hypothetical protein
VPPALRDRADVGTRHWRTASKVVVGAQTPKGEVSYYPVPTWPVSLRLVRRRRWERRLAPSGSPVTVGTTTGRGRAGRGRRVAAATEGELAHRFPLVGAFRPQAGGGYKERQRERMASSAGHVCGVRGRKCSPTRASEEKVGAYRGREHTVPREEEE